MMLNNKKTYNLDKPVKKSGMAMEKGSDTPRNNAVDGTFYDAINLNKEQTLKH